jgi:hypothetical protein
MYFHLTVGGKLKNENSRLLIFESASPHRDSMIIAYCRFFSFFSMLFILLNIEKFILPFFTDLITFDSLTTLRNHYFRFSLFILSFMTFFCYYCYRYSCYNLMIAYIFCYFRSSFLIFIIFLLLVLEFQIILCNFDYNYYMNYTFDGSHC